MKLILDIVKQPSTWRGLIWIMTALGLNLAPSQSDAIITAGMSVAGAVGVFTSDKKK
jgi:hypothetical protein